jgi:cytidylate kinase
VSRDCFVVAIDGPSGAGKSTVARRVAERLGLRYLDTGALYRAVGLAALEAGISPTDAGALEPLLARIRIALGEDGRVLLDGRDVAALIRTQEVGEAASKVSSLGAVRAALIDLQRAAACPPGAVAEGRDMGTVVFPDADLKVFLDADVDERARRRALELQGRGHAVAAADVRAEISERDLRDSTRSVAPLRVAPGSLVLDSTALTVDDVVARIVKEAASRRASK